MKETINLSRFRDAFQIRKDSFSYEGLEALFDFLLDCEESTGEELELDPIGLCGEYIEYGDVAEFRGDYSYEDAGEYESVEDIETKTTVIRIEGSEGFIVQSF